MGIDKLNMAAWAAGFAMAPLEEDMADTAVSEQAAESEASEATSWRSAKVPAQSAEQGIRAGMRQWFAALQRKATA